jgi:hypothetical protein
VSNHLAQTSQRDRLAKCVFAFAPKGALASRRAGFVPGGTPKFPAQGGVLLNEGGETTDYLLKTITGVLGGLSEVSIQADVEPAFAMSDDAWHHILGMAVATRFAIQKTNLNRLYVTMAGTLLTQILEAALAAAWNEYGRNVFTVSGTSGDNDLWLNDTQLLTAEATAWSPADSDVVGIGSNETGGTGSLFEGWIHSIRIFDGRLVESDHIELARRAGCL